MRRLDEEHDGLVKCFSFSCSLKKTLDGVYPGRDFSYEVIFRLDSRGGFLSGVHLGCFSGNLLYEILLICTDTFRRSEFENVADTLRC